MIINFKFRIFINMFYTNINIGGPITSTGFILNVLCHVLLYSSTISSNLSIYNIEVIYFQILLFTVLINFSATTDFNYVLKAFLYHYLATMI